MYTDMCKTVADGNKHKHSLRLKFLQHILILMQQLNLHLNLNSGGRLRLG